LLYFLTPNKNDFKEKGTSFYRDRCCHLAICLQLILFHCSWTIFALAYYRLCCPER